MCPLILQLFYEIFYFISTKLIYKIAVIILICLSSFSALSQDQIDPAKLIFKVTLPTSTELELNTANDNTDGSDSSLINSVLLYRESIDDIEQNNDPYHYELLEHYAGLGDAYQSLGRHEEAISNFDSAIQISKIQNGLYNLDQVPFIEKIIQSYIAMGDEENVTLKHEYMHYLHLENFTASDPDRINSSLALADWYIASFFKDNFQNASFVQRTTNNIVSRQPRATSSLAGNNSVSSGGLPNSNSAQFEAILNGEINDLHARDVEDARLLKVGDIYEDLQRDIYATEQPDVLTIIEIARRIAALSYITKQEMDFEKTNFNFNERYNNSRQEEFRNSQQRMDHSYESGRNALQYVINIFRTFEARPRFIAAAIIELADWQLAYGKIATAEANYQEAYRIMANAGSPSEAVDNALNGIIPKIIPSVATHFYTKKSAGIPADTTLIYQGHIDLSYNIDKLGNVSEVVFHDNNQAEARLLQRIIEDSLLITKFRPIIQNGELLSHGRVNLRYYYAF